MKTYDAYLAIKNVSDGMVCLRDQKGMAVPMLLAVLRAEYGEQMKTESLERVTAQLLDGGVRGLYKRLEDYAAGLSCYRIWCVTDLDMTFGKDTLLMFIAAIAKHLQGKTVVICTGADKKDVKTLAAYCKTEDVALDSSYLSYATVNCADSMAQGRVLVRKGGLFWHNAKSGKVLMEDYEGFYGAIRLADKDFASGHPQKAYEGYLKVRDYQKGRGREGVEDELLFVRLAVCRLLFGLGEEAYGTAHSRALVKRRFAAALPQISRGALLKSGDDYRAAFSLMLLNEAL